MSEADTVIYLHDLADRLVYFNDHHFTPDFIHRLKSDMANVFPESRQHDLDMFTPSDQLKTRMEQRVKRKNLVANHGLT